MLFDVLRTSCVPGMVGGPGFATDMSERPGARRQQIRVNPKAPAPLRVASTCHQGLTGYTKASK